MTQEEKDLLLKDLCARLPYRVRCKCINGLGGGKTDYGVLKFIGNCHGVISNYYEDIPIDSGFVNNVFYPIENIKPYLRPMSSMTEEERNELKDLTEASSADHLGIYYIEGGTLDDYESHISWKLFDIVTSWLNAHHFDYRGLIEMGLAIEALEGMYNFKTE